jgi:2-polyprenyl-6-methoxyphenol hydroxylase-like FAD-dependent oxidoreductase
LCDTKKRSHDERSAQGDPLEQRLIVVGAGIAGLNLALALGRTPGFRIVLLERDSPTGGRSPEVAFTAWRRPGVAHFRQSHIFHPRLLELYRRRHPDLLAELRRAGVRELAVEEALPDRLRAHYLPRTGDRDCTLLLSRRATLEAVLRDHVARLPAVELVNALKVTGVIVDLAVDCPRATGVRLATVSEATVIRDQLSGDVIVDASGRLTRFPRWLRAEGIQAREEVNVEVDTVYYTRYYRLRSGRSEPTTSGRPVFGRRDFLSCCVYPSDHRHFSVTLTCAADDQALREALADPDQFQRACASLAEIAPWVAPERAEPTTGVMAMARFRNYWRSYVAATGPVVLNFFAIGDALAHTNPAYGAGCSWAAQHAHILAEVLGATLDPTARANLYDERVRADAYPSYARMAARDQSIGREPHLVAGLGGLHRKLRRVVISAMATARAGDAGIFLWSLRRKYLIGWPRFWSDGAFLLWRIVRFSARGGWLGSRTDRDRLSRAQFLGLVAGARLKAGQRSAPELALAPTSLPGDR